MNVFLFIIAGLTSIFYPFYGSCAVGIQISTKGVRLLCPPHREQYAPNRGSVFERGSGNFEPPCGFSRLPGAYYLGIASLMIFAASTGSFAVASTSFAKVSSRVVSSAVVISSTHLTPFC